MPHVEASTIEGHAYIIVPMWMAWALDSHDEDGGKVLRTADLIPDEAHGRRGTWRITVEFDPGPDLDTAPAALQGGGGC
ncbi:hypothetical protein [Sorangium cellulosum]|uniref:Uncharacterized protein n=1 Tax=Sorangium cellulosum So0157-2 TaxID=1254432 RepID=S4Y203_SORCE|nr:hypothetical protein [Sorangium cellulosum]AGP39502.1 hypothetical protein SCE1572_36445 [Sorangium cellulosum So0157-2]